MMCLYFKLYRCFVGVLMVAFMSSPCNAEDCSERLLEKDEFASNEFSQLRSDIIELTKLSDEQLLTEDVQHGLKTKFGMSSIAGASDGKYGQETAKFIRQEIFKYIDSHLQVAVSKTSTQSKTSSEAIQAYRDCVLEKIRREPLPGLTLTPKTPAKDEFERQATSVQCELAFSLKGYIGPLPKVTGVTCYRIENALAIQQQLIGKQIGTHNFVLLRADPTLGDSTVTIDTDLFGSLSLVLPRQTNALDAEQQWKTLVAERFALGELLVASQGSFNDRIKLEWRPLNGQPHFKHATQIELMVGMTHETFNNRVRTIILPKDARTYEFTAKDWVPDQGSWYADKFPKLPLGRILYFELAFDYQDGSSPPESRSVMSVGVPGYIAK